MYRKEARNERPTASKIRRYQNSERIFADPEMAKDHGRKGKRESGPNFAAKKIKKEHSSKQEPSDSQGNISTASSKTLGRHSLSESPVKQDVAVKSEPRLKKLDSSPRTSPIKEEAGTSPQGSDAPAVVMQRSKPSLFAKVEKAHRLKEVLGQALIPGTQDTTISLRVIIVATPTLCNFWDPGSKARIPTATPGAPEQPPRQKDKVSQPLFTSFAHFMEHVDVYVKASGNTPAADKPKYKKSFDKVTKGLQKHVRIMTPGGLDIIKNRQQWTRNLQQSKEGEGLFGEAKVFVCVGNGRLLGDGTVVEF